MPDLGSDDKSVLVWTRNDLNGPWASRVVTTCDAPVWRVAWSVAGCVLAVSSGDDAVSLWKEASPATGTARGPRRRPPGEPGRLEAQATVAAREGCGAQSTVNAEKDGGGAWGRGRTLVARFSDVRPGDGPVEVPGAS